MQLLPVLVGAGILLAAAGCARSPAASPAQVETPEPAVPIRTRDVDEIRVTVNHNRPEVGALAVFVEPEGGTRASVGSVNPGETQTFGYRVQGGNRRVRLIGVGAAGAEVVSPHLTVPDGSGLGWDVLLNTVRLR